MIEGILARGDRRLCNALIRVYEKGGISQPGLIFDDQIWRMRLQENRLIQTFILPVPVRKMKSSHGILSMQV